jgi:hypothetical protein
MLRREIDKSVATTLAQAQRELMQVADYKQPAERQTKEQ